MKLHELRAVPGSSRAPKRKGRGRATGQGTTAGRGMNGQNSRSGGGVRLGFEGGQMPLYRRIPKRGFTNIWRKEPEIVNIGDLNKFEDGTEITAEVLRDNGLIKKADKGLKILGDGKLEKKLTVKANKFSKSAIEAIEKAGGTAEAIGGKPEPIEKPKKKKAVEAVAEEPVVEEAVAEEPVAEEPVAEEPVVEEPVAEEPPAEEPVAEEVTAETEE